ncbi:hypothetical protein NC651_036664 [Populus alba x Populus x berolinensis]|nr:hypothetical protein NC651_036664 [Populus alba x Populus x berolinensis]
MDESNRLSGLWAKTMGAFNCDNFRIFTKEKLRKFVEQQLMEKDKKVVFLEKQLKEKKVARNRSEKERGESGASWMQTKIVFETLKANFNDF